MRRFGLRAARGLCTTTRLRFHLPAILIAAGLLLAARPASATPAFARKYGTSCVTCHTIYPKLNPFGEAFRRNGFRFPGDDSEVTKQEAVPLGRDAYKKMFPNAVWPATVAGGAPLALGFNGDIAIHPQSDSGAAEEDNGAKVVISNLIEEGHLWAGGTIGNTIGYFAELTANGEEPIELEHATLQFSDLAGPKHALNLLIGKGGAQLTSFGMHSTYVGDHGLPMTNELVLMGLSEDGWTMDSNYTMAELNGMVNGRIMYSAGLNDGANDVPRSPHDFYVHVGYKAGGVRLDGEENSAVPDPMKPWAESAVTVDAFVYHSSTASEDIRDRAWTVGGQLRAQFGSLENDLGGWDEMHNNGGRSGDVKASVIEVYDELSYVVFPWLVPGVRVQFTQFKPDGGPTATHMAINAGAAALIRANIKAVLTLNLENSSSDFPTAGDWGGVDGAIGKSGTEIEAVSLGMAYAY